MNCFHDHKYNCIDFVHNLVIPKADDFVALRFEIFCTFCVVFLLIEVLAAIEFDDEFCFWGAEIGDVVSNGVLSSEIDTEFIPAQVCPQFALGGCEFFA